MKVSGAVAATNRLRDQYIVTILLSLAWLSSLVIAGRWPGRLRCTLVALGLAGYTGGPLSWRGGALAVAGWKTSRRNRPY